MCRHVDGRLILVLALTACATSSAPAATIASQQTTPAPASPAPSGVAAPGQLDDRFGFLISDPDGMLRLRAETTDATIASFRGVDPEVSADGRAIAFWEQAGDAAALRVWNAGDPSTTRALLKLASGERGGRIAWSTDGKGLVIAVTTQATGKSVLVTVDAASGSRDVIAERLDAGWYPVAWDPARRIVAAAVTRGDGSVQEYVAFSTDGPPRAVASIRMPPPRLLARSLKASADGRYVFGIESGDNSVVWWRLAEETTSPAARERYATTAVWNPTSVFIAWIGGPVPRGCATNCSGTFWEFFSVTAGSFAVGAHVSEVPMGSRLLFMRPDGSAAVIADAAGANAMLLPLGIERPLVPISERGILVGRVRLR